MKTILTALLMFTMPGWAQLAPRPAKTAHPPVIGKRYPSLLWEISGNGLKKPSYLFGTMHVSDKLAFHLGDSFYTAIKSADIVALETNPETWQDDYSQSVFFRGQRNGNNMPGLFANRWEWPSDHMRITSFAIDSYEEAVKAALAVEPSMINGMLYRTYGKQSDDFEEDTFLDMYIFQTGKKLGKRVGGVENFQESEKLVMEAYRDMLRDQNKKKRSYDYEDMLSNPGKVEDAYRKGDLDLLDSLEGMTVFSDAFQEKFLYKRNEIQANNIDSIIRRQTLFVGVGAAHLPGKRGVIEMLRQKGYRLRPVPMDERNSLQKENVDKIRTNNVFTPQTSDDGFYTISIPGNKFYRFTDWNGMDVVQYADMVNGAYYMVTRIKTNHLAWGHSTEQVHKKIDSLLYENIPGKLIKKTPVTKNGYRGFDIINRTRRGDHQRYQVFVTPFEVIIFKMSGNGDYITGGNEASQFFGSIKMKEFTGNWQSFTPATGGFTVQLPHSPALLRDNSFGTDRLEYAARDEASGNSFLIMKADLHNYTFIEEDSFELNLMDESYGYSSFIDKQLSRKFSNVNGYPALESKFKHKDGSFSTVKYIIRGPVYYAAIAHHKNDNTGARRFLESFAITPFVYPVARQHTDTSLHITVTSPVYPKPDNNSSTANSMEALLAMANASMEELGEDYSNRFGTRLIGNDTIGEKILVTYNQLPQYSFSKDSAAIWRAVVDRDMTDSSYIIKQNKQYTLPDGTQGRELILTDTNSSRQLMAKTMYQNGRLFSIYTITDTSRTQSAFITSVFGSFKPADTLNGESLFTRKTDRFFKDLFGTDSTAAKRAHKVVYQITFDSLDIPLLQSAIDSLNWTIRDYLNIKSHFIAKLGRLKSAAVVPYLKQLYWKVKDTTDWQSAILNALLDQRNRTAFLTFKELMLQEPPIVEEEEGFSPPRVVAVPVAQRESYAGRWHQLYDSLSLTKVIFPDILQLVNVEDYRNDVMNLLQTMVDSGYLKASDYESYFPKIYLEGKLQLKKQLARENRIKMSKIGREQSVTAYPPLSMLVENGDEGPSDAGNPELDRYAVLLLPFKGKNPGVQTFFDQLMTTQDRRLLYNSFMLLVRNNQLVPDSLFNKYAQLDQYRAELYTDLETAKKSDRFPRSQKTQLAIARSLLYQSVGEYERLDTLVFLDKLPVSYEHRNGYVYFFKYKRLHDDLAWQIASVGMQPNNPERIDIENTDFTSMEERKLEIDKPVKEQLQKMLKELLYARRPSASVFYDARSYTMYRNQLSEMVKSQRYRD